MSNVHLAVALLLLAGCATANRTAPPDGGVDAGYTGPPHCNPGAEILESWITVSGGSTSDGCGAQSIHCTRDVTFTPTTSTTNFGFEFDGPLTTGDGGTGAIYIGLVPGLSIDSLVGVPVRPQNLVQTFDCSTPDMGDIPGEPMGAFLSILRDAADGAIIVLAGEGMMRPDGSVEFGQEILPELKFRWVSTPAEDCLYRSEALELTVVATGEKVLGHWDRRAHVTVGKYGYLFLVRSRLGPLTGCGENLSWMLIRDGFLHPVRDGG